MSGSRARADSGANIAEALRRSSSNLTGFEAEQIIGGRYRLVSLLARGGMAELWIAEHAELRQRVAIKFLTYATTQPDEFDFGDEPVDDGPDPADRFRQEAQITAQLAKRSRHIVAVSDAGSERGTPYFVMEYVQGATLAEHIRDHGTMSLAACADLVDAIADALTTAHDAGVIHRDLKPSNVMVSEELAELGPPRAGPQPEKRKLFVRVADFGVAKASRTTLTVDKRKETSASFFVGSPAYASPEQLRAEKLDARSDLWSLAVVAYEALTGVTPFEGEKGTSDIAVLMLKISKAHFTPAGKRGRSIPAQVDAWFSRALQVERSARFATAAEMATEFRLAVGDAGKPRKSILAKVALGIAAVAVILALGYAATVALGKSTKSDPSVPSAESVVVSTAMAPPVPHESASGPAFVASAAPSQSPPAAPVDSAAPSATASVARRVPRLPIHHPRRDPAAQF